MSPATEQLLQVALALPEEERLELAEALIASQDPTSDLPDWHRRELERRRSAAEADPGAGIPWEVVKARLAERS